MKLQRLYVILRLRLRAGARAAAAVPRPQRRGEAHQCWVRLERWGVGDEGELNAAGRALDGALEVAERALAARLVVRRELLPLERRRHRGDALVDRRVVRQVAALVEGARHGVVRARPEHADGHSAAVGSGCADGDFRMRARPRRAGLDGAQADVALGEECLRFGEDGRVGKGAHGRAARRGETRRGEAL